MNTRTMAMLAAAVALAGCVSPGLAPVRFVDEAALPTTSIDDAAAVYLVDHHRYAITNSASSQSATWSEAQEHCVIKVLSEDAFALGSYHITIPKRARLKDLRARTITPQGEVIDVDVTAALSSTYQFNTDDSGQTRSFQFPRVEVGSVLEYTSTIVYDFAFWSDAESVARQYPIVDYRLEITVDRWARPDLLVSNADPTLRQERLPDGRQLIGFALSNVKPIPRDAYRAPDRSVAPWWLYRTIEWRFPRSVSRALSTWGRAANAYAPAILEGKDLGDFAVRGHDTCAGNVHCVVRSALDTLHTDVALSEFSAMKVRPLDEVKRAGLATNHELALALWSMLRLHNIAAQLAPTTLLSSTPALEDFPAPGWLDHTVVYVPTDDGGLWVDPSCESCAAGELPVWSRGARAIVLSVGMGEYGRELQASPFQEVTGRPARASLQEHEIGVQLDDNGDVNIDVIERHFGNNATHTALGVARHTDDELRKITAKALLKKSAVAELTSFTRPVCDRRAGSCEHRFSYRVPAAASIVGDHYLLEILEFDSDVDRLGDEKLGRTIPLVFWTGFEVLERVTVHVPAGYVADIAASGHKARRRETEGLRVEVDAVPTTDGAVLTRRYVATAGQWPATRLPEFQKVLTPAREFARLLVTVAKAPAPGMPAAPAPAPAPAPAASSPAAQ
jgi:hypothetical protein